jgi:hypothetical protein
VVAHDPYQAILFELAGTQQKRSRRATYLFVQLCLDPDDRCSKLPRCPKIVKGGAPSNGHGLVARNPNLRQQSASAPHYQESVGARSHFQACYFARKLLIEENEAPAKSQNAVIVDMQLKFAPALPHQWFPARGGNSTTRCRR